MPKNPKHDLTDLYQWAGCLTSEGRGYGWAAAHYCWTDQSKLVRTRLQHGRGLLIAISGAIGSGKSSLHQALTLFASKEYGKTTYIVSLKWPQEGGLLGAVFSQLLESSETLSQIYQTKLSSSPSYRPFMPLKIDRPFKPRSKFLRSSRFEGLEQLQATLEANQRGPAALPELRVSSEDKSMARRNALFEYIANAHSVLVDLPDYPHSDLRSVAKDLDAVNELWMGAQAVRRNRDYGPNFFIFLQREQVERRGELTHYFLGKWQRVALKPLLPKDLLEMYKLRWSDTWPFDQPLLERIAVLARGNPRRFLVYISRCLEHMIAQDESKALPFTSEMLREAIPDEQLRVDLGSEMIDLFPRSEEMRQRATSLVRFLIDHWPKEYSQTELSSLLGFDPVTISRLLPPLELSGFLSRAKGTGAVKTVRATM